MEATITETRPEQSRAPGTSASLTHAIRRVDRLIHRFPQGFPSGYSDGLVYRATGNTEWTPGFWTGLLWLAYRCTGDQAYRARAEALTASFAARLDAAGPGIDTHDLGFLFTLSCIAEWHLTGSASARLLALRAADSLATRYWTGGRIIQAWGSLKDPGDDQRGRIIVDSAMNMPLLFWAARESGEARLHRIGVNHLDQCVRFLVRADGSTCHTYYVDPETGEGRYPRTLQGFSDQSCWARGQAWALYGFALAYRHTREERYRDIALAVAGYFLDHLPLDRICCWDLIFDANDGQERDTSAAAIAASGLLELSEQCDAGDPRRDGLRQAALEILEALTADHLCADSGEHGILRHGVCHRPQGHGVNECCLWGDYFYLEALVKRDTGWASIW